jgi:hypothetical protein
MRRCLASVAQHELNALVQDTKKAITDLEYQRQSALQAIEMAQMPDDHNGHATHDTQMLLLELVEKLLRLNDALDQVMQEAELIEQAQASPGSQRPIPWDIPLISPSEARAEVKVQAENGTCKISQFYPCGATPHDCPSG